MKKIAGLVILLAVSLITGGAMVRYRVISVNAFLVGKYDVTGVDVSHYQGKINWNTMEKQGIGFAIIKATEGSGSQDKQFAVNWKQAEKTDLMIGAYHFFSFDSAAETQAENYIQTVGSLKGKLPPVVDFEYYGGKQSNPPKEEETREKLQRLLAILEEEYGEKPIVYATMKTYKRYLKGYFDIYPLWIRNVYYSPEIDMRGKWTFWQYSDEGIMEGYKGKEKYIDLNVFHGSREELKQLVIK